MAVVTYDQHVSDTSGTRTSVKAEAILKIVSLFGFAAAIGVFLLVRGTFFGSVNQVSVSNTLGNITYQVPYTNTLYENFGFVQEPEVNLPLKTTHGYVSTKFLLDSGAVVSTLPLQAAQDTGVDLTQAQRLTLQGFSGVPAFAYLANITVQIAGQDFTFPATFTESTSTSYILGRKGFFDQFTINFDHTQRVIIISRKNGS